MIGASLTLRHVSLKFFAGRSASKIYRDAFIFPVTITHGVGCFAARFARHFNFFGPGHWGVFGQISGRIQMRRAFGGAFWHIIGHKL